MAEPAPPEPATTLPNGPSEAIASSMEDLSSQPPIEGVTSAPTTSSFSTATVAAAAAAANTPASLAALLATALTDVDALREEVAVTRQRADRAERLLKTFGLVSASMTEQQQEADTKPTTNGTDPTPLPPATVALLTSLEERTTAAERERDQLSMRLATLTSNWNQLEGYLNAVDTSVREARRGYSRVVGDEGDHTVNHALPPMPFQRNDSKRTRTDSMFSVDGYTTGAKRPRQDTDYDLSRRSTYISSSSHRHIPAPHHHHHHHTLDRQPTLPVHPLVPREQQYIHRSPARQPSHLTQRSRSRSRSLSAGGSDDLDAMLLDSATGRPAKERGATLDGRGSFQVAPPGQPYPARNAQNQRLCRQCGLPGRYKDGRCVEKWGPGPMGPGTVCDRCRKRAKRVERRGTGPTITMVDVPGTTTSASYLPTERESSIRSSLIAPVPTPGRTMSVPVSASNSIAGTPQTAPGPLPLLRTVSPIEADMDDDAEGLLDGDAEAEVDELEQAVAEATVVVPSATKTTEPAPMNGDGDAEDLDMDLLEAVDASEKARG
ncbi:hypothetical protein HMN09_00427300 [Mycena chlorophos]|uniref:Uncharacterized protein n=1 Tax=Mycena chlorophos TaxID=658473 RepID=A0A8H6THR2_MYCCL|nr:hypothetical protein HMN09_00427300 [Mycena chlorophos]